MLIRPPAQDLPCTLRRSRRARRLQAVARGGRVEVVIPSWARPRHLRAFLRQAEPWIRRRAALLEERVGTILPPLCVDGASVLLEGEMRSLGIRARSRTCEVRLDGEIVVELPASQEQEPRVRSVLEAWLRERARTVARRHLERYSPRLGVVPRGLRIKSQKTLWGSCGSTGLINLNWRLIGAPPPVLEYIVVHELCHLRERNHGAGFWALVGEQMPEYRQHRAWLKEHGMSLG